MNTNLWPAEAKSPGGPFPHRYRFNLNAAARDGLIDYCQTKKLTTAQAVREIFSKAAEPQGWRMGGHFQRGGGFDDLEPDRWIPPPPLKDNETEKLPPGGVRFPDLRPESARKLATQTGDNYRDPTILIMLTVTVALNDRALAGLVRTMRERNLNHQQAARTLLAEHRTPGGGWSGI